MKKLFILVTLAFVLAAGNNKNEPKATRIIDPPGNLSVCEELCLAMQYADPKDTAESYRFAVDQGCDVPASVFDVLIESNLKKRGGTTGVINTDVLKKLKDLYAAAKFIIETRKDNIKLFKIVSLKNNQTFYERPLIFISPGIYTRTTNQNFNLENVVKFLTDRSIEGNEKFLFNQIFDQTSVFVKRK